MVSTPSCTRPILSSLLMLLLMLIAAQTLSADPYPGTEPLTWEGDLAARLVDGVDRFLLRKIEQSVARRPSFWQRDFASIAAYEQSVEPQRARLAHILGVRDARVTFAEPELISRLTQPAIVGRGPNYDILAIRWPAFGDVWGEGLLLMPRDQPARALHRCNPGL